MTIDLAGIIATPPSGRPRAVLLDGDDYAQSVLLQGRALPIGEPMAYANFFGQVQDLLQPDAAMLSLGPVYAGLLEDRLQTAMGARSRTGFALRTMLGDVDVTARAVELVTLVVRTQRRPVVLQIPSPRQWLTRTHPYSGDLEAGALGADDAENASMYVADWLRNFASLPLAGVLLDDRDAAPTAAQPAVPLEVYSPVANTADHYRWTLAMRHFDRVELRGSAYTGAVIPPDFWRQQDVALGTADFLLGAIPADAVPEVVLGRVRALGQASAGQPLS